jgi:alanyl-tRNA synthetase
MTEKLYYQDADMSEFEGVVVEAVKEEKRWRVVLDRTYFYPEGGGQPADKGWLNDIPVLDVRKEGDLVYHYLPENPGEGKVRGKIDGNWRGDFMQQHTGQHIISGALWKVGGYKTVSVHMGLDYTSIEIDAPGIPAEDLARVEKLANQVIRDDLPLDFIYSSHRELDQFPLRKPSSLKGEVRLVKIGDFDCVACGGLHLDRTRKVGLVKAIGIETLRNHARIAWKIGERAFEDYWRKDKIISELRGVLATREDMFVRKAGEIQEELMSFKRKCGWFENRLADMMADRLYEEETQAGRGEAGCRVITGSWHGEDENLMKKIIKSLLKKEKILFCLVNVLDDTDDRLQWSIGCSQDMAFPFDGVKTELLSIIEGKGGGRPPLWQGIGAKPGRVRDFFAAFRALVPDFKTGEQ